MRFSIASIKVRYSRNETGTLASRNSAKNEKNTAGVPGMYRSQSAALAAVQKGEALEQVDVLLVFQESAVQGWDQLRRVARSQHVGRHLFDQQQFDPVKQLG